MDTKIHGELDRHLALSPCVHNLLLDTTTQKVPPFFTAPSLQVQEQDQSFLLEGFQLGTELRHAFNGLERGGTTRRHHHSFKHLLLEKREPAGHLQWFGSVMGIDLSDLYGRFWLPSEINILLTGVPSSAASIDTSDASNKPP
ncbi:hypothetical protein YC2023_041614 [Brassica napus]